MADWHITASSTWVRELGRTWRIDPEFYHPHFLALEKNLDRVPTQNLSSVCHITDGNHFAISEHFLPEGEYRYLRGKDLKGFFLERADEDPIYLPKSVFDGITSCHMYPLDVLVSVVGTIGAVGIIPPDWPVVTGSCKLAILRAYDIDPYFLAAFLACKYGQFQMKRNMRGALQMGLTLEDLPYLRVYKAAPAFQQEITTQVQMAYQKMQESKRLYQEAEEMLLEALGLHDLDLKDEVCSQGQVTAVLAANRFDAEFFETKYEHLIQAIKKTGFHTYLGKITTTIQRGIQPEYSENGPVYVIKSKNVGEQFTDTNGAETTSFEFWQVNERSQIRQYDVLVNSTGRGTLGRANCYLQSNNAIADGHVAIVRTTEQCDPVYLGVFLNSKLGRMQSERLCVGSSGQTELYPQAIASIHLLLPDKKFQLTVRERVLEAYSKKFEGASLLEQAKNKVESLIERGSVNG